MEQRRPKSILVRLGVASAVLAIAACNTHQRSGGGDTAERVGQSSAKIDANPQIGDFVLYAERSVELGGSDVVSFGNVGVRSAAAPSFGPQLVVGADSVVPSNLLAPSVSLGLFAQVGDVQTSSLQNGGGFLGAQAPFPLSMPLLPLSLPPGAGGTNVAVAARHRVTLHPGSYGTLDVRGTAILAPGVYTFTGVTVHPQASLLAGSGPVDLRVSGQLSTGEGSLLQGTTADQLSISVAGNDGPGTATAVSIGSLSQVTGLVSAPHGTISIGDMVVATGAFAGFDVAVGQDCVVTFQVGLPASSSGTSGGQVLSGYSLPPASPVIGPVPTNMPIGLGAVLPVRNPAGLQAFIDQVSDPTSSMYRQYISVSTFASTYGALPGDYTNVMSWAQSFGTATSYANNLLVDVSSTAGQIEQALAVNLVLATRPDGTQFYAPDRIPVFQLSVNLDGIAGIDNYIAPKPLGGGTSPLAPAYQGSDLRSAYLGNGTSCSSLNGSGQQIGLVEFDGFTPTTTTAPGDIGTYETNTGLSGVPGITVKPVNLAAGQAALPPSGTNGSVECALDIEMAVAMAPAAQVLVFEGTNIDGILSAMATTPNLNQASSSWGPSSTTAQRFVNEMAAQGQSFYQSSGDNGLYQPGTQTCTCTCTSATTGATTTENLTICPGTTCAATCAAISPTSTCTGGPGIDAPPTDIRSFANITLVGGTALTTGTNEVWSSETTWPGSGGGYITSQSQPTYQQGLGLASNRSSPDVAFPATNIYVVSTVCSVALVNGACPAGKTLPAQQGVVGGTSVSAPLWASFTSLMNQQGGALGTIGFANPLIYQIGKDPSRYPKSFHDINDMSNDANACGNSATATTGYDQATGWGTPTCGFIQQASVKPNINVGVTDPANAGPVVCMSGTGFTPGGTVTVQYTGIPEFDDSMGNPTTFVALNNVPVDASGNIQFRDNRQVAFEVAVTTGVPDCTAAREATTVAIQAVDNTTGVTSTINAPTNLWCGIGPLSFGSGCPTIEIGYHQLGACNDVTDSNGNNAASAGPFAAYVLFGIESIYNETSTSFTFDPTQVFIQRGPIHNFWDPGLTLYSDIFGPFAAVDTPVGPGVDYRFSPSALGAAITPTLTMDGAQQADMTPYGLNYNPGPTDPAIEFTKSNASQFNWPSTPSCNDIVLQ